MKIKYIRPDGTEIPETGACIQIDNVMDTFTITVRSLGGVSATKIETLIQRALELERITHDERVVVVK